MTETSANSLPATEEAWADLARIYRRICLLRSRGREVDAERMEARDLVGAITHLKASTGNEFAVDEKAQAVFARERERVADAEALVEILAPALADRLGTLPPAPVTTSAAGGASVIRPAAPTDSPDSRATPKLTPTPPPTASGPPGIADLLDDMLAQERTARPGRPNRRAG